LKDWVRRLTKLPGADFSADEPMSRHTSFKIGGPADLMATVKSSEALVKLLEAARENEVPVTVLGGGTNVLVLEGGVRGLVVRLGDGFSWLREARDGLACGAAVSLARLLAEARRKCLSGLEFAAGIPGTVGGGLWVNCGALGRSLGSRFSLGRGVTLAGREVEVKADEVTFEYRSATFPSRMVITEAEFSLEPGDPVGMDKAMHDALERRRNQPLDVPSAGCVFKNPPDRPAAKLIDEAGLKGFRRGGASVSERHANYIVNSRGATASDVLELIEVVRRTVRDRFGVELETEVRIIGERQ